MPSAVGVPAGIALKRISVERHRDRHLAVATMHGCAGQLSQQDFLQALGKRVRQVREQLGLPRKVLAEQAGVSERYLAQLELRTANASVSLLRNVAAAANVPLERLLSCDVSVDRERVNAFIASLPEWRLADVMDRLVSEFGSEESVRRRRIALIGMRGAGKTTLGGALAKVMRRPYVEVSSEIERRAGMSLSRIFQVYGPGGFRKQERQCLEELINSQSDMVIGVGGGVVAECDSYALLLANCHTVWIRASPEEHISRAMAPRQCRPVPDHSAALASLRTLLAAREALYARADAVVDTSGQSVKKSLAALLAAVN